MTHDEETENVLADLAAEEEEGDVFERYDRWDDEDDEYYYERGFDMQPIAIELPQDVIDVIAERCARNIHEKVEKLAKEKIAALVDESWRDTIKGKMEQAANELLQEWMTKPRPITNTYGEATGKETTFSERLLKDWEGYLKQRVNDRGEASEYHSNDSRFEWMIKKFAMPQVQGIAQEACQKIEKEARARVQEAVSAFIAQQLTPRVDLKAIQG